MAESQEPQAEPLSLDEVASAAAELQARSDAAAVAAGFLELVQRWAAPSAVLAAVRDPAASAGFRLLPSLCAGSLTLGIEKTLARLAEDNPESLKRPMLLRGEEVPGVRVRDNVVVPWSSEGESGLLVLRGVPRPSRPGLGEALALAGAAVWPRLIGAPAARIEALVGELAQGAARLSAEAGRQLDRLRAAAPPPAAAPDAAPDAALEARAAELDGELAALKSERDALRREMEGVRAESESGLKALDTFRHKLETAGLDLAAARQQTENARRELEAAREDRRSAERELEAAKRELEAVRGGGAPGAGEPDGAAPPSPRATTPEAQGTPSQERLSGAVLTAVAAAWRAAFVPPLLRVSIDDVAAVAKLGPRPPRRLGIALLDRDVVSLEPVAADLEAQAIEVRLANQPEELALLLRSPEASAVDAVVCDVMSFRPDQNLAGLLRGWEKDRPGLVSYLSYDPQSPVEQERARRVPMSLTAGHVLRPLTGARLAEMLDNLAKRQGKTSG
jgi:hypothetical protein